MKIRVAQSLIVGALALVVSGCPNKPMEDPGTPVDVGGFNLVYKLEGDGPYTIVFENGLGDIRTVWNDVQDALAETQTTIAYDRAGVGESDRGPDPRIGTTLAEELKTMLTNIGQEPPYILVGHSFGGVVIRQYTQLYPEDIAALVFVDPDHENLEREEILNLSTESVTQTKNIDVIVGDLKGIGPQGEIFAQEFMFENLRADDTIPAVPLILLHAGAEPLHANDPDHPEQITWDQIKDELHREIVELSPFGEFRAIPNVGHEIQVKMPEVVIQAIQDVITQLEEQKALLK